MNKLLLNRITQVELLYRFLEKDPGQFPHPNIDWKQFSAVVKEHNDRGGRVFCASTQSQQPWIQLDKAAKLVGTPSSSVCSIS
jgi:hypothetical protein